MMDDERRKVEATIYQSATIADTLELRNEDILAEIDTLTTDLKDNNALINTFRQEVTRLRALLDL